MPRKSKSTPLHVAVDTGGTFTDCVWLERGRLRMVKVFSTPADPSEAIADAISQISHSGELVILHGTTVGTNTLLQRKGAKVAFVTTEGFEDSIEIGRQARPKLYDFFFDAIPYLVASALRFGVNERTDKDGNVLQAPTSAQLKKLVERVGKKKPDAIAVSFLFSFVNPQNEKKVVTALRRLKLPISVSHEILPEFREYERASTVVINAYLQPIVESYLRRLSVRFKKSRVFVMQSSGGLTSLETASREPVRTVLSGPAGGVVGAVALSRRSGIKGIIGFDMGGTSTDVCLVESEPSTTNESEIAGLPIRVPMLNIHTVGAGGGSLARFDAGGALRVGSESAGADPGPICYGKGTLPTVTDANLILGRLRSDRFLGGSFVLQEKRARDLCRSWLKRERPEWSVEDLAQGMLRVVNANMEKALRVVSVEKGYDPRDFSLVAFGGAGALHACELAAALEIPRVIVPFMPGALSAIGILLSDVVKDYSRTVLLNLRKQWPGTHLKKIFRELSAQARSQFKAEGWTGQIKLQESLDMRYRGQGFEISIDNSPGALRAFHRKHKRRFGHGHPDREVELVTVRLRASIASKVSLGRLENLAVFRKKSLERVNVLSEGGNALTPVLDRSQAGFTPKQGPAIITEYSATTVVPPGWSYRADRQGNLIIQDRK